MTITAEDVRKLLDGVPNTTVPSQLDIAQLVLQQEAKIKELEQKLAEAGVRGSPPNGGQGTIPDLIQRNQVGLQKM